MIRNRVARGIFECLSPVCSSCKVLASLLAALSVTAFTVAFLFALPVLLINPVSASAGTVDWQLENPTPGYPVPFPPGYYYGTEGGVILSMSSTFDSVTKRFKFSTVLGPTTAGAPSSFSIVVNAGPTPWSVGQAAIIEFDGNDPADPKLTVYGYNAAHALGDRSWEDGDGGSAGIQPPDLICSSLNNASCGSWVNALAVTNVPGGRKFEFDIDATEIVDHTPLYSTSTSSWYGTGFGRKIGLWFHPAVGRQFTYDGNGYIVEVTSEGSVGFFDAEYLPTNSRPECRVSATNLTLRPDQGAQIALTGFDADTPPSSLNIALSANPLPATWSNCSFSDVVNPATEILERRYICDVIAPVVSHDQTYSLSISVTDESNPGANSIAQCQTDILIKNTPPTCGLFLSASNLPPLQCEGTVTTVDISSAVASDADGDPVTSTYTISCSSGEASLQVQSPNQLVASLTGPGLGSAVNCTVEGRVDDGFVSTLCSLPLAVSVCELDCSNTPLGTQVRDDCGVCGGTNSCIDCTGVPFGSTAVDRCGICGGDGSSCLNCTQNSNFNSQISLDGAANSIAQLNKHALRSLKRVQNGTKAARKFEARKLAQVQEEYLKAWRAIWSISVTTTSCANVSFCQTVSVAGASNVEQYDSAIERLKGIAGEVAAKFRAARKNRAASNLIKAIKGLDAGIASERANLVLQSSVCP